MSTSEPLPAPAAADPSRQEIADTIIATELRVDGWGLLPDLVLTWSELIARATNESAAPRELALTLADAILAALSSKPAPAPDVAGVTEGLRNHVVSRGGLAKDKFGEPVIPNGAWAKMLRAADLIDLLSDENAAKDAENEALRQDVERLRAKIGPVILGFSSYQDGRFELIVRNDENRNETTLRGQLEPGQLETVDEILPTCVYVHPQRAALSPTGGEDAPQA